MKKILLPAFILALSLGGGAAEAAAQRQAHAPRQAKPAVHQHKPATHAKKAGHVKKAHAKAQPAARHGKPHRTRAPRHA